MNRFIDMLAPVAAALSAATVPVACAQESEFEALEDITYTVADGEELKLDLAKPASEGPFPALLVIHGGAWRSGDKAQMRDLLVEFAEAGYVAASPQYRFCPEHTFPAQVHDVKAAVRWLREHADEHAVDPGRIGAVGFSAGGHLAMMLGLTGPDDGLEGDVADGAPSSRVQAAVSYFGPTDFAAEDLPLITIPLRNDFIGGSPEEEPEATALASPLTHVTDDDPPILAFQGTKDPLIPATQAVALAEAMTEAGVAGRVELLIGAGHGWGGPELERTKRATFRFFDRHLKGEGKVPAFLRE